MVKEFKNEPTMKSMRDSLKKERNKDLGGSHGITELFMKESGRKIDKMVAEHIFGKMEGNTKDSYEMARFKV